MAEIQNIDSTKCWQGCGGIGILIHCWWEFKMVQPLWKTVCWFLINLNILLPYNLAIVLLGIYSKELKTYVLMKTCTQIFNLFITLKTWKQPMWPLIPNRIKCDIPRQCDITQCYKEMSYEAMKRHGGGALKRVVLTERIQSGKLCRV